MGTEMRARLYFKKQFSNSDITKIEGMKYLDEQITLSMKRQCLKEIEIQTMDISIYEVHPL